MHNLYIYVYMLIGIYSINYSDDQPIQNLFKYLAELMIEDQMI